MRLISYYTAKEYRVTDIDTGEAVYTAGNSPYDSQQYVSVEYGVGIGMMKVFAEQTGKAIAKEKNCEFLGVEFDEE